MLTLILKTHPTVSSCLAPHPQEDMLLLAGWCFAVRHHHVLGVLKSPTVQEEDALGRLLLFETVQHQLDVETCRPIREESRLSHGLCSRKLSVTCRYCWTY